MIAPLAHKITAFVLVFILFAHNINTLVIVGEFISNQAEIARDLCVQRDNQQGCNGKCQLAKVIKQSSADSNTDVPTQEIRRMSLDAVCFFDIKNSELKSEVLPTTVVEFFNYSKRIVFRFEDIDTPPPNFI